MLQHTQTQAVRVSRGARGFSLLEMVIAIGILGFGMLSLGLMQVRSLTESSRGRHTGDAAAVARSYLEEAHRIPWSRLDTAEGAGFGNPTWADAPSNWNNLVVAPGVGNRTEQSYAVTWAVDDVAGDTCLRDVQVRVTWSEEGIAAARQLQLSTRRYNFGDPDC